MTADGSNAILPLIQEFRVRRDLWGRYPKRSWSDDLLTAPPVAKGRPR
jgi:hypothetical protein